MMRNSDAPHMAFRVWAPDGAVQPPLSTPAPKAPTLPKIASSTTRRVPLHQQLKDPALGQLSGQSHPGDSPAVAKCCCDSQAVSGTSRHSVLSVDEVQA